MKKLSRRDFLRMSALTGAGIALAGCAVPTPMAEPAAEPTVAPEPSEAPTPTPKPQAEQVTLEIQAWEPEYLDAERQIWDLFEEEHPNIKVQLFSVNEPEQDAYQARVAGGYTPAMVRGHYLGERLYQEWEGRFLDLTTVEGIPWDQYTVDLNALSHQFYGYNLRLLAPFAPIIWTWVYHQDLMQEAGLDPHGNVGSWDDLKGWLEAGTKWADSNPDVDYFWDQAGTWWMPSLIFPQHFPVAFPEGQVEHINACYLGEAKFNDPDSPWRPVVEFLIEAYQAGWLPEGMLTREWETDMEASYIAEKSVMMYHGPWPWDKALAADPTVVQGGFPSTPPAEGQETWMQFRDTPLTDQGYSILTSAEGLPEFEQIQTAFVWYNQSEIVELRSPIYGLPPLVVPSESFELDSPQWNGIVKDIDVPGGQYEHVKFTEGPYGWELMASRLQDGTPGAFSQDDHGALYERWSALFSGEMSVQEYLDLVQKDYEASYDLS